MILVTGAQGFVGSRLVPFLQQRGHAVVAADGDVLDLPAIETALRRSMPKLVIHLAAISHVPTCERNPAEAFRVNLGGTASLVEAMRRTVPESRLLFASTAQVYAAPTPTELGGPVVIYESRTIAPQNLYARTKWEAELVIEDALRREGRPATVLRLFNHTHKSQSAEFFMPHVHRAILAAQHTRKPEQRAQVPVGNLAVRRDVGSLPDLLAAFAAIVERPSTDPSYEIYNVCSGTAKSLSVLAIELARRLGVDVDFVVDPARVRSNEPEYIQGSHDHLTRVTGWTPHCESEADLVEAFLAD